MPFWKRKKDEIPPALKAEMELVRPIAALVQDGQRLGAAGRFPEALDRFNAAATKLKDTTADVSILEPFRAAILLGTAMASRGLGERERAREMLREVEKIKWQNSTAFAVEAQMDAEEGAYAESVSHYLDALDAIVNTLPEREEARRAGLALNPDEDRELLKNLQKQLLESAVRAGAQGELLSEAIMHRASRYGTDPLQIYAYGLMALTLEVQHGLPKHEAGLISAQVGNAWSHTRVDYGRLTAPMREVAEQIIHNPAKLGGPFPFIAKLLAGTRV